MNAKAIWEELNQAKLKGEPIRPFTETEPEFSVEQAYAVQKLDLEMALGSGEAFCGYKMGLTSRAKQQDVGVDSPIRGYLTESMEFDTATPLSCKNFIHPRIEPEVVIVLGKPLSGKNIPLRKIVDSIAFVSLAVEVLDSRFQGFQFKLADVIADNASAAGFFTGHHNVKDVLDKVPNAGVVVWKNGKPVQTGTPAAILGNPLRSIQALAAALHDEGRVLDSGALVLTGGITTSVPVQPGDHMAISWPFERLEIRVGD